MEYKRLKTINGTGTITRYFKLAKGQEAKSNRFYEITDGVARELKEGQTPKGSIVGFSHGGDRIVEGKILLDINQATVYVTKVKNAEELPTVGDMIDEYLKVVDIHEKDLTYEFVIDYCKEHNDIPEKTSDLVNDSGFITNIVDDLINYYRKSEVNDLLEAMRKMHSKVVEQLPTEDISETTIYLVPKKESEEKNVYDEYIYVENEWEKLGDTKIDLTDYVKLEQLNEELNKKLNSTDIADWAKQPAKPTYNFDEIQNKPDEYKPEAHTHTMSDITDFSGGGESYTLPIASDSTLGGIKVGAGLSISEEGTLSATGSGGVADSIEWSKIIDKPEFVTQNIVQHFWKGTQAEYDELVEYDNTTMYLIVEEEV